MPPALIASLLALGFLALAVHCVGPVGGFPAARDAPPDPGLAVRGLISDLSHTLIEWTGVCLAFFTAALALALFRLRGDPLAAVIGGSFFCTALFDVLHTLASATALRYPGGERLAALTGTASRIAMPALLIVGASIVLRWRARGVEPSERWTRLTLAFTMTAGAAGLTALYSSISLPDFPEIPEIYRPGAPIHRPWDLLTLALWAGLAGPLFWRLHHRKPTVLSGTLLLLAVPSSVSALQFVVGSPLLGNASSAHAHLVRMIAYFTPLAGLFVGLWRNCRVCDCALADLERSRTATAEEAARYRDLFEQAPVACQVADAQGVVRLVNRAACVLLERSEAELAGRPAWDNVDPLERSQARAALRLTLNGRAAVVRRERTYVRPGGQTIRVAAYDAPLRTPSGDIGGLHSTLVDTTQERRNWEEREAALSRLHILLQTLPAAVAAVDVNGKITVWNAACERLFGWTREEVLNTPLAGFPDPSPEHTRRLLADALTGRPVADCSVTRLRKDGSAFPAAVSTAALRDANGEIVGAAAVIVDLAKRGAVRLGGQPDSLPANLPSAI
ncbi:MAG: PAS domain-containing protein [Bryobacteraceae bacterium]|nr:PAS domain-containing protein [Bryobacteraceae bacterium]